MTHEEDRINFQRTYWQEKARELLDYIFMASLEGKSNEYRRLKDDFDTALIIAWRFDRKLQNLRDGYIAEEEAGSDHVGDGEAV